MPKHVTLATLFARNGGNLTSEDERHVTEHLKHCVQCTELQETVTLMRSGLLPRANRPAQAAAACPEAETIANYYNGHYFYFRRRKIQKHIASCSSCREMLVELKGLESATLEEEDHALLATLPPYAAEPSQFQTMPHLKDLSHESKPWHGAQIGWADVKALFTNHPVPSYSLVGAALLFFVLMLGWPQVQDWQSTRLAQQGLQQLARDYEIPLDELRPAGPFQPKLLSSVHGSVIPRPNIDSAEKFQQSLEWDADNRTALRGQALAAYFNEEFEKAEHILLQLQAQYPQAIEIANDLGLIAARLRTPEKAFYYFDLALKLQPDSPEARYNRAHLLQKLERYDEAQKAWQAYLDLNEGKNWQRLAEQQKARLR